VATVNLNEGSNTITLEATDAAGNSAVQTETVTLDTTAPEISVNAPGVVTDENNTVTVTITTEQGATVTLNGETLTGTNGVFVKEISLVPGGNTLYITATDSQGNTAETSVDITYSPPVQTTVEKTGYSKTTAYAAGAGALILGLIIGMILAMFLWKKKPEAPTEEAEMEEGEEEIPEEEEGIGEEELAEEGAGEEELFGEEELEEPEAGEEEGIPELEETEEPGEELEDEDIDFDVGEEAGESPELDENLPEEEKKDDIIDLDDIE